MYKESGPVSYMREHLALRLLNDIGVPSPRSMYVRLFVNGDFYGLYLLVEELDSTWLERQRWPADTMLLKAQHWKVRPLALPLFWGRTDPTLLGSTQICELRTCALSVRRPRLTSSTRPVLDTAAASAALWPIKSSSQKYVGCAFAFGYACSDTSSLSARRQVGTLARRAREFVHDVDRASGEPRLLFRLQRLVRARVLAKPRRLAAGGD